MPTKTKKKIQIAVLIAAVVAVLAVVGILIPLTVGERTPQAATAPSETQSEPLPTQPEPTQPPREANPYGINDFRYEGDYLTCTAGESVLGIDVSEFQEDIDWEQVRDAGIEFVMIRVGFRGYGEEGGLNADANAQTYYQGAKQAGLKIGAYFFSQAINPAEAAMEAMFALEQVKDWELDMPLVYDWEYISDEARTANVTPLCLTLNTIAFCTLVEAAGHKPMLYTNQYQSEEMMHFASVQHYPLWLAMYSDEMTYPYKMSMWQYTYTGRVPGIETDVDIDLYFPE